MAWSRTDDLDGSTPAEPVTFGFKDSLFTIDLSEANLAKLAKALSPFLDAAQPFAEMPEIPSSEPESATYVPEPTPARRAESTKQRRPLKAAPRLTRNGKRDFGEVRSWANANGYSVRPTGRIPTQILDAYDSQTPADV